MIQNDLLRTAVRVEYTLLRVPLGMLDERVVSRFAPRGSLVQNSFARTINVLDTVAERLLSEPPPPPLPDEAREDVEQLTEDLLETEEEQSFSGELAEDDELRRVQAELRAKHAIEEREDPS